MFGMWLFEGPSALVALRVGTGLVALYCVILVVALFLF